MKSLNSLIEKNGKFHRDSGEILKIYFLIELLPSTKNYGEKKWNRELRSTKLKRV